jgi:hypothetical protein
MLEDSVICSATSMPVKRKTYESNKCHLTMPDRQTSQPVATLTRSLSLAEGIDYCVNEIGHRNVNYDEQQVVNSPTRLPYLRLIILRQEQGNGYL